MPLPVSMDATWLDGAVQFNGQELRRADSGLFVGEGSAPLGVWGGVVRHNDNSLMVTVNASDLITIQPGAAVIAANAGVGNGVYRTALGAAETGQLAARNATNPRMDRVIYRVLDTSVVGSHGAYTGRIEVLTGEPNATPANGMVALPSLAIELARITVPATGGGVATVDSTWRTYAAAIGGVLPVPSVSRLPASGAKWTEAVAIDTGLEYRWSGSAWVQKDALAGPIDFTSGIVAGANIANQGDGTRAWRRNSVVTLEVYIVANAAVSGAVLTMPAGWRPVSGVRAILTPTVTTAKAVYLNSNGELSIEGGMGSGTVIFGSITYVI